MKRLKSLIAVVLSIAMTISIFTVVSATTDGVEYITISLVDNGANAVLFGTQAEVDAIIAESDNTAYGTSVTNDTLAKYITQKMNASSANSYRVRLILNKDNFDTLKDTNGLVYDKDGNIPFEISTDLSKNNGINMGRKTGDYANTHPLYPYSTWATVNVNAEKPLTKLYAYTVMSNDYKNTHASVFAAKINYTDGSSETITTTVDGLHILTPKVTPAEGYLWWGQKLVYGFTFSYTNDGAAVTSTAKATSNAHPYIVELDVDPERVVSNVQFMMGDSGYTGSIIALTAKTATKEQTEAINTAKYVAQLKEKYPSASDVTETNCYDVKDLLGKLIEAYIPAEEVDYITSLENAAEAKIAEFESFIAKYDYFEIEKNIPFSSTIGSKEMQSEQGGSNRVFNSKALDNKASRGYTYDNDGTPFKVAKDENGNYVRKITVNESTIPDVTFSGEYTINLEEATYYKEIRLMSMHSYGFGESYGTNYYKPMLNFTVTYETGDPAVFTSADIDFFSTVSEKNKDSLLASETTSYVNYKTDTTDKDGTAPWIEWDETNGYKYNSYFDDFYVPVYKLPVDSTRKVKSISVTCAINNQYQILMAATGKKATLADALDKINVTSENYAEVEKILADLPEADLTAEQEEKLEIINKQIKFFKQEYTVFEIDEDLLTEKVFASGSIATNEVDASNYYAVGTGVNVFDKDAWDTAKDENGLVYSMNNIPFKVNTNKGLLFGKGIGKEQVTINVTEGNYDSISAVIAIDYVADGSFKMIANYADGTTDVDPGWYVASMSSYSGNLANIPEGRDADSFVVIMGGRMNKNGANYEPFTTKFYFPVVTLDTDETKELVSITFENTTNNVSAVVLALTGSVLDSTSKKLERVFNSYTDTFSIKELETAHEAFADSYATGLYTNETYGLDEMAVEAVKYKNNTLSGKVLSYVNKENNYSIVARVINEDGTFAGIKILATGSANLNVQDFSETLEIEEGQKVQLLLWEDYTTIKPYMSAVNVN